ncbi:hypothetical protein Hanom_Chr14g01262511 [Helianthus anomalus]
MMMINDKSRRHGGGPMVTVTEECDETALFKTGSEQMMFGCLVHLVSSLVRVLCRQNRFWSRNLVQSTDRFTRVTPG